eukprot:scaffold1875_cov82-Cylindrotheca_fusiformis.AAC.3
MVLQQSSIENKAATSTPALSFGIDQICDAGMMVAQQSSVENVRSDFRGRNGGSQQSTVENSKAAESIPALSIGIDQIWEAQTMVLQQSSIENARRLLTVFWHYSLG